MGAIVSVTLHRLRLPLIRPYRLSYRTFEEFEPYVVEVETGDGAYGFGDGHISPGSSEETREGGWAFCQRLARQIVGLDLGTATTSVLEASPDSKVAASALATAIENAARSPLLRVERSTRLPLLTPINALEPAAIGGEVDELLAAGFRTFKVKVGKDVEADLARVAEIQRAVAGRATLRLDANRAFSREQAVRFAQALDPDGIELFEQPCAAEDWDANAAVAAVSNVPLMLDEPICTAADIERAAGIEGVGFCKLKLKRFVSLDQLHRGLERVRALGMEPVLGDGLGSEITCWMEACVAARTIRNAGEFNGFLKPKERLLREPLPFRDGAIELNEGFRPSLDRERLERATLERASFD